MQRSIQSGRIVAWAQANGLLWSPYPDERWFRSWEPYDTIAPPGLYLNAVTRNTPHGPYVLAEPWYAPDLSVEPLGRAIFAYAAHPNLMRRAAMRVGEFFLTRVVYLESPPPPKVTIGEALWDAHVETFAASGAEAAAAFPPRLRALLAGWGFQGHLEIRPGGLLLYMAGLEPVAEHYQRLMGIVREVLHAATGGH
jgi:hypothetical protein